MWSPKVHTASRNKTTMTSMNSPCETPSRSTFGALSNPRIQGKTYGTHEETATTSGLAARSSQLQKKSARNEDKGVVEKVDTEKHWRPFRDSRPKTPGKSAAAPSPLRPKTPNYLQSCPPSPSIKTTVKRTLLVDQSHSASRLSAGYSIGSTFKTDGKNTEELMICKRPTTTETNRTPFLRAECVSAEYEKIGKLSQSKSIVMDMINEAATTNNSEKPYVECSGSLVLPGQNVFHSPRTQYDNPIYQEDSPPLSERLRSLESNMRALSPLSSNVEPLQSRLGASPFKCLLNDDTSPRCDTGNCRSLLQGLAVEDDKSYSQSLETASAQTLSTPSGSLTPFEQFKQNNPDLQMTLVKQYLSVLNTATREELLQLKGIGPKRAADIVELRDTNEEPFRELQDLKTIGLSERQAHAIFNCNVVRKVIFPPS